MRISKHDVIAFACLLFISCGTIPVRDTMPCGSKKGFVKFVVRPSTIGRTLISPVEVGTNAAYSGEINIYEYIGDSLQLLANKDDLGFRAGGIGGSDDHGDMVGIVKSTTPGSHKYLFLIKGSYDVPERKTTVEANVPQDSLLVINLLRTTNIVKKELVSNTKLEVEFNFNDSIFIFPASPFVEPCKSPN